MRADWTYKTWADVLTIINGKNQSAVESANGEFPIYGSGGIMGYASEWLCPENSVIIGRKGNINKPLFVTTKFWNVDTAFGLCAKKELLLPKYLFYFCIDYNFERHNKAVTIPSLTKADLLKISILVPPINVQQSIVSELDKINELIGLKTSQLKELDNLSLSLFHDMFGDPIENEKKWEVKKLGEIFETSSGGTPSKSHNEYYEGGTIPWLRSGEVSQGFISETEMYITEAGLNNSSAKFFPPNTVVVAMYGATVGQVGVIKKKMTTNQAICGIFPNEDYSSTFMFYFLIGMKPLYLRNAAGGAQPNISQGIIKNTLIPIVPLPLQLEFEKRIERIEQQKQQISSAIKDLETLFASRMQYWFG